MATQADVDAIEAAIARGESSVRFSDGREVRYRSVPELERALSLLQGRLATVPMMRTTAVSFARD